MNNQIEKFTMYHVMLYSKYWYKRSDDIWSDLKKCLTGDGYDGKEMDKEDIVNLMIIQFQRLPHYEDRLLNILTGIAPSACWKHGYYTNKCTWLTNYKKLPVYDYYEAIVRYILSFMVSINVVNNDIKLPTPDFKNILPKNIKN